MSLAGGGPDIPGRLTWSADRLVLRVALPRPGLLEIAAEGRQRLRLAGYAEVPFTADRFRLVLPLRAEPWPDFVDVAADNLRAATPVGGDASVRSLRLHLDFKPEAQSGDPALEFSLKAEAISPPSGIARPLGPASPTWQIEAR